MLARFDNLVKYIFTEDKVENGNKIQLEPDHYVVSEAYKREFLEFLNEVDPETNNEPFTYKL